eukprot:8493840-Pyramimonas_sp.AAC.1
MRSLAAVSARDGGEVIEAGWDSDAEHAPTARARGRERERRASRRKRGGARGLVGGDFWGDGRSNQRA